MNRSVLPFEAIDATQVALVGGKGASLGELSRIDGVRVPPGFVVTTEASELDALRALLDEHTPYAVRSSATAEDLPTASFAGQHESFLNVVGRDAVLEQVKRCRDSLFTERAVAYRKQQGFEERVVRMAVVVQQMVPAEVSGVLFTADPLSGHRHTASIEAVAGLGEALVSGRVTPDTFRVRDGRVVERQGALLSDAQLLQLVELGRRIEAHFGRPQDLEWCFAGGEFFIVQSRPITTLFPIPQGPESGFRVFISVGHQQMMTDAMKPLGWSVFQLTAGRPMFEAGGRLFVDVTPQLQNPVVRGALLELFGKSDPLILDAVQTAMERGQFPPAVPPPPRPEADAPDPSVLPELIAQTKASIAALRREIATKSGSALFEFILEDLAQQKRALFEPRNHQAVMAGIEAAWWLNEKLEAWLGEKNAADVLTQSVPNNVTSEMGLALLDVADVLRPHAESPGLPPEAQAALQGWLDSYGMRCVGEIDLTRPRWSERPADLLPILRSHVKNFGPGEAKRRFEHGRRDAEAKELELLQRLRTLPEGEQKARETKTMIDRLRAFIGYREFPKYGIINRHFIYKQALLREVEGLFRETEDAFFLTFHELHEAVRTRRVDEALLRERKEAFRAFQRLTPPRVLTSEGEGFSGSYRRENVPAGALVGLAVSTGVVEGRARVIVDVAGASLEPGDILVTAFTDPSWTPLFVGIKALVTEVGGLMTHGAVIAREYGLPAVVSVEGATQRIRDGQRIRVNGTDGLVEFLD